KDKEGMERDPGDVKKELTVIEKTSISNQAIECDNGSSSSSKIEIQKPINQSEQNTEIRILRNENSIIRVNKENGGIEGVDKRKRIKSNCILDQNKWQKMKELNNKKMKQNESICEPTLKIDLKSATENEKAMIKETNSNNTKIAISALVRRSVTNIYQKTSNTESQKESDSSSEETIKHNKSITIRSCRIANIRKSWKNQGFLEKTMELLEQS
ncbi:35553_t:CDS:2, partial [Racocetra persica]